MPKYVVEQRVSNLAQGLLILATMSRQLLSALGHIPQAVLAGLFFVMGVQALEENGITLKLVYLLKDHTLVSPAYPLKSCRLSAVWAFVGLELLGFGATFAISQTVAAVGFPIIVVGLVPIRVFVLPRFFFTKRELRTLDQATASGLTLESVGGSWEDNGGKDEDKVENEETVEVDSHGMYPIIIREGQPIP